MNQIRSGRPHLSEYLALRTKKDDGAAVATFVELLQQSRHLAQWLWGHFAKSEATRERLAQYLKGDAGTKATGRRLLAWLAAGPEALVDSRAAVAEVRGQTDWDGAFGGLTRRDIRRLIHRYQAGGIDVGAFLLVYGWRFPETVADGHPRLNRASAAFFAEAIQGGRPELLRHAVKAYKFLADKQRGSIGRTDYGYANWWKLSVLDYALNHPKPRYRTGELKRHLAGQRLNVHGKDIREFCKKHGIQRDSKGGRPRRPVNS